MSKTWVALLSLAGGMVIGGGTVVLYLYYTNNIRQLPLAGTPPPAPTT